MRPGLDLTCAVAGIYPGEEFTQGAPRRLISTQLRFEDLKKAASLCHAKIVANEWNKTAAREYLNTWCFNTAAQDNLLKCASNCSVRAKAMASGNQEVIEACAIKEQEKPSEWREWKCPATWDSGLTLMQFTEPCMHQLFLGIMKHDTTELQNWASCQGNYANLRTHLRIVTESVECLHLTWSKVQPYKGEKLGGWYSENFMGFARITPWAYSVLDWIERDANEMIFACSDCREKSLSRKLSFSSW